MNVEQHVTRRTERFNQDSRRVISKMYLPDKSENRLKRLIKRILDIPKDKASRVFQKIFTEFSKRHVNIMAEFTKHYQAVCKYLPPHAVATDLQRALIGAYFTHEYSIQAAAFFNPSMVPHPDQSGLAERSLRFIMSFRSTGEGHISSIEFRSGVINEHGNFHFDPVSPFVYTPDIIKNPQYNKQTFQLKLAELIPQNEVSTGIFSILDDEFSLDQLEGAINNRVAEVKNHPSFRGTIGNIKWLANSNYQVKFDKTRSISERVLFPVSENESKGIEDARFVLFTGGQGEKIYYATYTAYNGFNILPMLIETKDFIDFKIITLNGKAVQNKGMALFPRKINGKYMMISRQDGENIFIMSSENIHFWNKSTQLYEPKDPREYVQAGNGGSPLEINEGWLLITHGVGAMRKYTLGAILLDKKNPERVIKWLPEPLLSPREDEREGYVPNVVYTCGALIHNSELIIPYAMSDTHSSIASIPIPVLLEHMQAL